MPIDWASMSIFKRTADVNLWGVIEVTKTFLPLIKKVQGRVVNFSSVGGKEFTQQPLTNLHAAFMARPWHQFRVEKAPLSRYCE